MSSTGQRRPLQWLAKDLESLIVDDEGGRINGSAQTPVYLIVKRAYRSPRSRIGSKAASCVAPCLTTRAVMISGLRRGG